MELGATVCGPNREPDCGECPCKEFCLGHRRGTAKMLPVRAPKKQKKQQEKTVFILRCGDTFALEKRESRGLLAGLWQFPNVEGKMGIPAIVDILEKNGLKILEIIRQVEKKHIFTHIIWDMRGVYLEVKEQAGPYTWLTSEQINAQAALPTAFRQFWEEVKYV